MASMALPSAQSAPSSGPDRRLIDGIPATLPRLHQTVADAAEAYISLQQRSPCGNETKLLFARMDWHGIGNDVNLAVRALATAVVQQRQIVFLPPAAQDRNANPWINWLGLSATEPWHWMAGAGLPFGSLFVDSACQKALLSNKRMIHLLSDANETDPATTLFRAGDFELAKRSRLWKPIWRVGLNAGMIPLPFRSHGLLWWFQVLTNYLVRAREPLSGHLDRHPAMRAFLHAHGAAASGSRAPAEVSEPFGRQRCGKRWCDYIGPGWQPPVWFDVGLQLRLGDVCGKHAAIRGQKSRKCSAQPAQDAFELMRAHGLTGRLFIASDSREALEKAVKLGPSYGFEVAHLSFNRARVEGNGSLGTELARRSRSRDLAVLVESLMDVLLLSRSSVLVGSMMSNFPRMALQMRVQAPVGGQHRYLALDGRTWCTRTSCRMNYSDVYGTV